MSNQVLTVIDNRNKQRKTIDKSKVYFGQEQEKAIIAYNKTEDMDERNRIYNATIKPAFEKLVENIFNTFKFTYFEVGALDVQAECVSHLVANMHKFQVSKGRAFSYFSIVAKNYLIQLNNRNFKRFKTIISMDETNGEGDKVMEIEAPEINTNADEFCEALVQFFDWNMDLFAAKDKPIVAAVVEAIRQRKAIDLGRKRELYRYLKEISCATNAQLTRVLKRMLPYMVKFKGEWDRDGMIHIREQRKLVCL
jgi:hypothetical protein